MISRKRFLCLDCDVDTGKIGEYYYINLETWLKVVGSKHGMLCIDCLENRLGRQLVASDFPAYWINTPQFCKKSQRLMNRMRA